MSNPNLSVRCLAYREGDHFIGVCLDLDIVEEKTSFEEAVFSLNDAILSHILAAKEEGLPSELMYRPAPKKYWKKLAELSSDPVAEETLPQREFDFYSFNPYRFLPPRLAYV